MADEHDNNWILSACAALVDKNLLVDREKALLEDITPLPDHEAKAVEDSIGSGADPLGEAYMSFNSSDTRRLNGETYTPQAIVDIMIEKASSIRTPDRVVDAGCGSGRFAASCATAFPNASIIAVDSSPIATLMAKTAVSVLGLSNRIEVRLGDFTTMRIAKTPRSETTLWIGNPPYVRHHDIPAKAKRWLASTAAEFAYASSGLSGMHVYFVLAIAKKMAKQDFGVLITSAEWLDVNYGSLMRKLLSHKMGITSLALYDKSQTLFTGTDTTSTIFSFDASLVDDYDRDVELSLVSNETKVTCVQARVLFNNDKWSTLLLPSSDHPEGYVRLGDFARAHRGIVTGDNKFWVRNPGDDIDLPTIPVVAHAKELMECGDEIDPSRLAKLIVLPQDLDELDEKTAASARRLIKEGQRQGVDKGYVAKSRKCWWSISVGEPATILMTYMARKPPKFVANRSGVLSLNVVHGIYPTIEMSDRAVDALVDYLNTSVSTKDGRVYSGGLTKFEPGEVENLMVPSPEMLEDGSWSS